MAGGSRSLAVKISDPGIGPFMTTSVTTYNCTNYVRLFHIIVAQHLDARGGLRQDENGI